MYTKLMKKKVAIACGGPSSEHEVSILSVQSILKNIDRNSYDISVFYIAKDLSCNLFVPQQELVIPQNRNEFLPLHAGIQSWLVGCDVVLLAGLHGEFVEDGRLQCILDMFEISYTGSGMAASVIAMDKYRSSLLVNAVLHISIPRTKYIDIRAPQLEVDTYPVVCKPNYLGSSVGVTMAQNYDEVKTYIRYLDVELHQRYLLLQEKITDAVEVSCGVLVDKRGIVTLLPPVEIIPQSSTFFDYSAKYMEGGSLEITPPKNIDEKTSRKISEYAAQIHSLFGCKTYSRSDFFVKGDEIIYLETNTLPGMTATSLLPKEANAIEMSYRELLDFLISNSI